MHRIALAVVLVGLALAPANLSAQNPDVIVGGLYNINSYGSEGGIYAYSVGTESCNVGDVNLLWVETTPDHPVIGQEMWRLRDGVLEQIGISWLKHSFCALDNDFCGPCTITGDCGILGVGCSDPYGAGLNGSQGNLGPRSQVNASTGVFPYPFAAPPFGGVIARRLQVHEEDLEPVANAGAQYFVTSHYVTPDDAQAGNGTNNSSYRQILIDTASPVYEAEIMPGSLTQQQSPGIQAWQDFVPSVVLNDVFIPNDGLMIVGHNVTDNGNGTWHYEYAVYNMNSDRCAGQFTVNFPGAVTVTNISMRDVDHHSGEPYDGTDWPGVYTPGSGITWQTTPFSTNPDANAIRWSTMYNFRFDANAPPAPGTGLLGVFKPGLPGGMPLNLDVPAGSLVPPLTNFSCVPGATAVNLNWTNGTAYDLIELRRDGNLIATLSGSATSFVEPGLAPGNYEWSLRGFQGVDPTNDALCSATVTLRTLSISDVTAFSGQTALSIPVLASNSAPLQGFSISVEIPADRLTVNEVNIDGTVTAAAGAEFVEASFGSGFATLQVVLDAVGPFAQQTIGTGNDQQVATMLASVSATVVEGETRTINLVDGFGSPAVNNTVRIDGIDQTPLTDGGTVTFAVSPTFIRGDCNSDGSVLINDAIFALNYLFAGGTSPTCFSACDSDDTGVLNIVDGIYLLTYLFVMGPPPPTPFPAAGVDPTVDPLPCL